MRRREFITLFGGAAAASMLWPLPLAAQRPKLPTIGVLLTANPEPFWSEFRAGLREHGYIEGQNIAFEFRSADGKLDLLRALADELVRLKVDIIVASQTPAVIAARQATSEIPIVMAPAGDPVGTGLVSSRRGRAATSPDCLVRPRSWEPKLSNSSARCCRPRGAWPSSPMHPIHSPGLSLNRSSKAAAPWALQSRQSWSAARRSSPRRLPPWTKSGRMPSWCRGVSPANPFSIWR